jgi:hypothetical protein
MPQVHTPLPDSCDTNHPPPRLLDIKESLFPAASVTFHVSKGSHDFSLHDLGDCAPSTF